MTAGCGSRLAAAAALLAVALGACATLPEAAKREELHRGVESSGKVGASETPAASPPLPADEADATPGSTAAVAGVRPALPSGFPVMNSAVPLPLPRSDPTVVARWDVPATPGDVYEFYGRSLPEAGHPITLLGPGGAGATIRFEIRPGEVWQLDLYGDLEHTVVELWSEER